MSNTTTSNTTEDLDSFLRYIRERDPLQPEFHQAVEEVMRSLWSFVRKNPRYSRHGLLKRIVEPERMILFRVPWVDDAGETHVNRGYRVQMNSAIGPYKGGLRFHSSANLSILKFLAFEQVFKNSLTTLPIGGGKGGSDFDPKGCSESEVMRFCQSFMTELYRYLGPDLDVPAGDIGVGSREIGYMYGQYKRITNQSSSVFTGKGLSYGGSLMRPEATGYGCVYFAQEMLGRKKQGFEGRKVVISGSGNVAQFAAEKCLDIGAVVISLSDSGGTVHIPEGLTSEQLAWCMELKNERHGRISEFARHFHLPYLDGGKPWHIACDIALPCATQNEINHADAKALVTNGCVCVAEGANMPSDLDAVEIFQSAEILYGPGKAANAGGVATSALEMSQNAVRVPWTRADVDNRLHAIMQNIHHSCVEYGTQPDGSINYLDGANIAGFVKVADAMLAQGVV